MDQRKSIHYKAIFKQDNQIDTIEYKAVGTYHDGEKRRLSFQSEGHTIDIVYDEQRITLKHDQSTLLLNKDKVVWSDYQLPYGQVQLCTKVKKFDVHHHHFQLKYELYDHQSLISTVYIYITMLPFVEDN
jgi:uncharacterized beta-barrel protein YwiB (DUF1934 family)